jgi:hypothetical protein
VYVQPIIYVADKGPNLQGHAGRMRLKHSISRALIPKLPSVIPFVDRLATGKGVNSVLWTYHVITDTGLICNAMPGGSGLSM